jgi:hypothetical protein
MTTEKTAVALRVLTAINRREEPEPRDVTLLRAYYPDHRDWPADELACFVIEEMLARQMDKQHLNSEQKSNTA